MSSTVKLSRLLSARPITYQSLLNIGKRLNGTELSGHSSKYFSQVENKGYNSKRHNF